MKGGEHINFFESELRKLIKFTDVEKATFAGRACYCDLGGGVKAKFQFTTLGHADHYTAIKANILNRTEGEIDTLLIRFDDILGKKQVRNPNFSDGIIPHVYKNGADIEWYVYKPNEADYKKLAAAISDYMEVFSERAPVREKESLVGKLRDAKQNPAPKNTAEKAKAAQKPTPER